jgi:hypothetical protein
MLKRSEWFRVPHEAISSVLSLSDLVTSRSFLWRARLSTQRYHSPLLPVRSALLNFVVVPFKVRHLDN